MTMSFSPNKVWAPKEWESHANSLLRERYSSVNYISVPDHDRGDGGIEGFSTDGNVYQMYCPESVSKTSILYEKQRNKMTLDIGKFISNESKLKGLFGDLKIKRWILVVPEHKTKEILIHATKQAAIVKKADLTYVENDEFRILVWDISEFKKEQASLLRDGIVTLKLTPISVLEDDLCSYQEDSPEFTENMTRKLGKLNSQPEKVKRGQDILTKKAIVSQNLMSELKQNYGEYYEQITTITRNRAEQLDIEALDAEPETLKINYQVKVLNELFKNNSKLHGDNLDIIATGTIADWLMNCTLDFN